MSSGQHWQSALLPLDLSDGLAVAHFQTRFIRERGRERIVFARDELRQLLTGRIVSEQGIGYWHGQPLYVLQLDNDELPADDRFEWIGSRAYMLQGEIELFRMLAFASQTGTWAREHRFCGSCGQPMQSSTTHRMRYCTPCGVEQYPRIAPCMIVLVSRGDEILLARSPRFVPGMYSVLAGFAEPGESIEGCVHREVMEETCIRVQHLRYIASQNWPFPHSLMLGFHAEYLDGDIRPQLDEIEDARWFNINRLPDLPVQGSIARYLIDLYLHERLGGVQPVLPY